MAVGYPDFFGMSIIESFGQYHQLDSGTIMLNDGTSTYSEIATLKSRIFNAQILLTSLVITANVDTNCYLDNVLVSSFNVSDIFYDYYNNNNNVYFKPHELSYDYQRLLLLMTVPVTCVESFKLSVDNNSGSHIESRIIINYATIVN